MSENQKVLVTGIKPTGRLHLGNYFGAIKPFLDIYQKYNSIIFIADLHALTTQNNPEELSQDILQIAADYLALGVDPEKTLIFKQSDIPELAELSWIFSCLVTVPYLKRAHAYKDAQVRGKEINVGIFSYPILMAADILLPGADVVPVGQDQKQHLEITRDTARKFNQVFGQTFKVPDPLILENVKTIPGTDGRKMSKSYKNTIPIFADREEIKKAVMSIPTDSKGVNDSKEPSLCKIFALHKIFSGKEELSDLKERYLKGKIGYKESKEILIENVIKFVNPLREKREKMEKDRKKILDILENGAKEMRKKARKKIEEVLKKTGNKI